MPHAALGFGRLVQSVGETVLPLNLAADISNIDIDEAGSAERRKGFQRALDSAMTDQIKLLHGFTDYDGSPVFVIVDQSGIRREA